MTTKARPAPKVYKAIAAVAAEMAKCGIPKDQTNAQDQYQFRGIDQIYNRLSPALAVYKLCILPRVLERAEVTREGDQGVLLVGVTLRVAFDLICAQDGSKHVIEAYGEALDGGDKATAKAMTAAYKSAILQAFCIPVSGSEDADSETHQLRTNDHEAAPVQGWEQWSRDICDLVRGCQTGEALDRVQNTNRGLLKSIARERSELYSSIGEEIGARRRVLTSDRTVTVQEKLNAKARPTSSTSRIAVLPGA